ncbi:DUF4129 domain-containing protein [Actinomadura logoneensis]|uniref:DUF4129 domain-containing protein n=1 Tax=Actinomadura logoneensis TaxID=2293572 RepID=A0A372JNB2_9ACTN|nr:DUF4129 domain-containing protein [Actinomadura logoneensis]
MIGRLPDPPPVDRETARELARRELEKPVYQRDKPSWLERTLDRFAEWLRDLFSHAQAPNAKGGGAEGWLSIGVIVLLVILAAAVVLWLMRGGRNRRSAKDEALLDDEPSTSADHRTEAERLAAAGEWPGAIRERLRAMARDLEERAILSPRPGRTADELAIETGAAIPELADDLRTAVRIFDDVWYGDRPGSAEEYARVTAVDDRLRSTKPKALDDADLLPADGWSSRW